MVRAQSPCTAAMHPLYCLTPPAELNRSWTGTSNLVTQGALHWLSCLTDSTAACWAKQMMGHTMNYDAFHPDFCFPHRPVLKMLSRNLVIASVAVVFLASTVSTAPVEDKEPEENDFEAEEGEEELSEEEEDDDDSKGQHMKGAGSQQATAAPRGLGITPGSAVAGESPNGQKLNGGTQTGQVSSGSTSTASNGASNGSNGRDGYSRPSGSSSHDASYGGQDGSKSEIVPPGVGAGGAGANGGSGSKVPGTDGGVHSVSISVVSSGQGSSGHTAAGHGSTVISSHTFGRPSAGQMSDGVGVVSSEVQSQPAGSEGFAPHTDGSQYENGETAHDGSQIESPEIPEIESNGNGHKQLLNGGETGFTGLDHFMAGTSQIQGTGGFDSFGTSPHLEITGILDQSSHDFLIGLMGGTGESFGPDTQTDGLGTLLDLLDTPPDVPPTCLVTDAVISFIISPGTADNGAQSKSPADTTDSSVAFDTMSHPGHSFLDYSDGGADNNGADLPDTNGNGNGRHKPVVDIQKGDPPGVHLDISGTGHQDAATEMHHTAVGALDQSDHTLSPYADTTGFDGVTGASMQTDMAGAAGDLVTDGQTQTDMTGQGHLAVTDGVPNYTDSERATGTGFTDASETHSSMVQTDLPVTGDPFTGVSSQTDAMGTGQPGATEQTQPAVSAGEQYHTSGQGPEGAENVELEDTC
ncbi:uncharacterized PE-PGRS family protein PE_PGRS54-like [Sinocyclocheilus rhinocerous]|uniref:uncharacterized PE-PGRS family protein PE_PGRS54-like n=1 Tax=Sinocyclocheilus rhinocerous TaxID=307959 RepID=UPI0007B8FB3B|nr:PREDICTED: uncharacterized PE-PGRS family protein PE_PGRS54-like [Sinocyclocheilus rhinocerous]